MCVFFFRVRVFEHSKNFLHYCVRDGDDDQMKKIGCTQVTKTKIKKEILFRWRVLFSSPIYMFPETLGKCYDLLLDMEIY